MITQNPTFRSSESYFRSDSGLEIIAPPPPVTRTPSRFYGRALSGRMTQANNRPTTNGVSKKSKKQRLWSPWKLILFSIFLGISGVLYLTHLFQTQNILSEVQQLRREYERAHRIHADTRRTYDRMTGPVEVYRQAEAMGMMYGGANDPVIIVDR
ncbi:MAG: hypothetical protein WD097_03575 [Balneolales bacterium]